MQAARRLGYTQSAISNQIAALERLVCARLVERVRGGSSISLTEAGRLLYDHAVVLIARLQAARTDVAAVGQESTAVLRVGYFRARRGHRAAPGGGGVPRAGARRARRARARLRGRVAAGARRCRRARRGVRLHADPSRRHRVVASLRRPLRPARSARGKPRSYPTSTTCRCSRTGPARRSSSTSVRWGRRTGCRGGRSCRSRMLRRSRRWWPRGARTASCRPSR